MASSNGSAGNVFRDRRGENPFQAAAPSRPVARARVKAAPPVREVESYIGQGVQSPNGSALSRTINGATISRSNPNLRHTYDTELRLGKRGA